jgi:hypothetical protein
LAGLPITERQLTSLPIYQLQIKESADQINLPIYQFTSLPIKEIPLIS